MSPDFSGQTLVGQSFAGENLAGADFSFADIRSVNFSQTNLANAVFYKAKAGLSKPWQVLQIALILLCSAAIGALSVMTGIFTATFLTQDNISQFTVLPGLLCLFAFASLSLPLIVRGFTPQALQSLILSSTLAIVSISMSTLAATAIGTVESSGGMLGSTVLLVVSSVVFTVANLTHGRQLIASCLVLSSAIALISYPALYPVAITAINVTTPGAVSSTVSASPSVVSHPLNHLGMLAVMLEILLGGTYIASRVKAKDEKFELIQKIATTFTTLGGTNFHCADLTQANFTQALLSCTNLSHAQLTRTKFHLSQQLNTAQLNGTILSKAKVRYLATSLNGERQTYKRLNLQGINLAQANLKAADLSESNISQATLAEAVLTDANLTKVQAIGTHFQQAHITGSCLESWNIDSTTVLKDINCQYTYLRNHQQERRPSSGQFKPGEFTQLFQEIIDTVDLIFQGGIDWQALHTMLAEANAQQRPQDEPLSIRSIENKSDGVVVVRVDAPPETDKAELHNRLNQHYQTALHRLEATYQQQLQAKDEQIAIYREHQANLHALAKPLSESIAQSLASQPTALPTFQNSPTLLVTLSLIAPSHSPESHSPENNLLATLQIGHEGDLPFIDCTRTLPAPQILRRHCHQWQKSYRDYLQLGAMHQRISAPLTQITNVSQISLKQTLQNHTRQLHDSFNHWLAADEFRLLRELFLENINPSDTVRIVLKTNHPQLWQFPWHSWDLLSRYPHAELTLGRHQYRRSEPIRLPSQTATPASVRILAIFGNGEGLDLQTDGQLLQHLPHTQVTVLSEPTRQTLSDHLWEQPWDILFFAGHSNSHQGEGYLRLNATDNLSLPEISHALRKACQQGLQLAIFNSCDGLGLAQHLGDLCVPQMIVMREPVPDLVAHAFLKGLLQNFSSGQPLPQAVREAREKLQGLENQFPCATWLPVLCQTATTSPLTWEQLRQGKLRP